MSLGSEYFPSQNSGTEAAEPGCGLTPAPNSSRLSYLLAREPGAEKRIPVTSATRRRHFSQPARPGRVPDSFKT